MKEKIFESLRYKFRRVYYKYIRTLNKESIEELFKNLDPEQPEPYFWRASTPALITSGWDVRPR